MGAESSSLSEVHDDIVWSHEEYELHRAQLLNGTNVSAFVYKQSQLNTFLVNNAVKVINKSMIFVFH